VLEGPFPVADVGVHQRDERGDDLRPHDIDAHRVDEKVEDADLDEGADGADDEEATPDRGEPTQSGVDLHGSTRLLGSATVRAR